MFLAKLIAIFHIFMPGHVASAAAAEPAAAPPAQAQPARTRTRHVDEFKTEF